MIPDRRFDDQHRPQNRYQTHPGLGCGMRGLFDSNSLENPCLMSGACLQKSSDTSSASTSTRKQMTPDFLGCERARMASSSPATAGSKPSVAFWSNRVTGVRVWKTRVHVTFVLGHSPGIGYSKCWHESGVPYQRKHRLSQIERPFSLLTTMEMAVVLSNLGEVLYLVHKSVDGGAPVAETEWATNVHTELPSSSLRLPYLRSSQI